MSSSVLTRAWKSCTVVPSLCLSDTPVKRCVFNSVKKKLHTLITRKNIHLIGKTASKEILTEHTSTFWRARPLTYRYFTAIMGKSQSKSYDFTTPSSGNSDLPSASEPAGTTPSVGNGSPQTQPVRKLSTGTTPPIGNGSPQTQPAKKLSTSSDADMLEVEVCAVDDLKDGEMREVDVGEGKALLVKENGTFHALGAKCTHYGAPLAKGAYCNGRVRCPWHGACFSVKTGDIEDFPGLDSIPVFEVVVSDGKVKVRADKAAITQTKRQKSMCKADSQNQKKVLIVGGGPASVACAETLRQEGFTGQISIATREKYLPYDRPKLSKAMDSKPADIALRGTDFYKSYDINILTEKEATSVDTESKTVTFGDSSNLSYDSLVLATGGKPRVLPIPGVDLQNVCILRTPDDANFIAENAAGKKVVIIGSSFIGMEVAASLADKAESVSVVDIIKVPFQLVLGEKVGSVLQKLHEDNGIKFYFERSIKQFEGADGKVTEAILSDDTRLPADLCVLGVGVVPATDFLKDSGIEMSNRGFIAVDKLMKTNKSDVYAAGDIVEFPLFMMEDQLANVQHWQMAHTHGRTAALSILGINKEIRSVPFFWTMMYKKSVRYTGYGVGYDDIVVHGDLDNQKFVACYTKGDEVIAVSSLNFDPIVSQAAEILASGRKILKSEIMDSPDNWIQRFSNL